MSVTFSVGERELNINRVKDWMGLAAMRGFFMPPEFCLRSDRCCQSRKRGAFFGRVNHLA